MQVYGATSKKSSILEFINWYWVVITNDPIHFVKVDPLVHSLVVMWLGNYLGVNEPWMIKLRYISPKMPPKHATIMSQNDVKIFIATSN